MRYWPARLRKRFRHLLEQVERWPLHHQAPLRKGLAVQGVHLQAAKATHQQVGQGVEANPQRQPAQTKGGGRVVVANAVQPNHWNPKLR